jgi:hypothetical protein
MYTIFIPIKTHTYKTEYNGKKYGTIQYHKPKNIPQKNSLAVSVLSTFKKLLSPLNL